MPRLRRPVQLAMIGALGLLLVAVAAAPAQAFTENSRVTVFNATNLCVQGTAVIDHATGGLSGNAASEETFGLNGGCALGLAGLTAAAKVDVYHWNGSAWVLCRSSDWKYGTTSVSEVGPSGPIQSLDYGGSASCGSGYYGALGYSYVFNQGTWFGGSVWSGSEFVP